MSGADDNKGGNVVDEQNADNKGDKGDNNDNEQKPLQIANMSDEDIMNFDPATLPQPVTDKAGSNAGSSGDEPGQSSDGDSDQEGSDGDAGGAAADDKSSKDDTGGEGSDSASADEDGDNANPFELEGGKAPSGDQPGDKADPDKGDKGDGHSQETDYKAEYKKLMAPFRAAKRNVTLDNIDDARRMMQMGVDYSRKMEVMKPYRRVLRTLEKAGLLDPDKINFLIDLDNKKPEAIKKLLKDNDIDPMKLDLEDGETYDPTDHAVSDTEMALSDVLDNIRDSESFERTVEVTTAMDKKSRDSLRDNPELLATINAHIENDIYDEVMTKVASERLFGRLSGLSDLQAYYTVGDALYKAGKFKAVPGSNESSPDGKDSKGSADDDGSNPDKKDKSGGDVDRKRAAGSPRGGAGGGKKKAIDLSKLTDEEIGKLDLASLLKET